MPRKRKTRGYNENNDEEDDGGRKYDVREKIRSERFDDCSDYLQDCSGNEITLKLIQRNGFNKPILVKEPDGLELRVPQKGFLVRDVRDCVGEDRIIDVMDVRTQKNIEMTMKDWCKYYEAKRRDRLLNVISLEFSHTELDELVEAPSIVRLLDWVDQVWPKFLKESQIESTNKIDRMKYPKVQKYCLMSVKGSYTDFHIDFGGTSVWYHILKGKKIFWMVPPTELNLTTFEEWTLSGLQQEVFFGDLVEECFRVELSAGNTFFIPSGWIHAVFTLEDSLVFGGNFLHSFGIENQLKVSKVEDATKVPLKFRYPFYTEIQWYVVQHYVYCLTGNDHLHAVSKSANNTPEKPIKPLKSTNETKASKNVRKKNDDDDDDDEDEDDEAETGSEIEQSDTNTTKRKSNIKTRVSAKRNKRGGKVPPAKGRISNKKVLKTKEESETETETEIDTDIDSDSDQEDRNKKKPATTCRMTKNSLLRLQYEVDLPKLPTSPNKQFQKNTTLVVTPSKSPPKTVEKQTTSQANITQQRQQQATTNEAPFDLDKFMYSNDAKRLNGWSSTLKQSSNQTSWSNLDSEPKEPNKIYITKYELNGLKLLVKHLSKLSGARKNLPALIRNSRSLLDDCKKMIVEHENDDPELAITGQPITTELLNLKKTDMNQLIEQFFKPSEITAHDETQARTKSPNSKIDSGTPAQQQQKNKFLHSNISGNLFDSTKNEDRKISATSTISDSSSSRKETKGSSSPNKKLSSGVNASAAAAVAATATTVATAAANTSATAISPLSATTAAATSTSTSQPPPRPKSPPTRPLSNNQYTSKTKKDNSLILPGSFADLIAATSTEKKVFDVSAADVTSAIFGTTKDLHRHSSKLHQKTSQSSSTSDPFDLLISPTSSMLDSKTTTTTSPDSNQDNQKDSQPPKVNSPEPPKMSPLKRFINPNFKPQNKEKLIFASAPYVSPITVSSQSRPNNLYPWQSPAPHQQPPPQHQRHHTQPPTPQKSSLTGTANLQQAFADNQQNVQDDPRGNSNTVIGTIIPKFNEKDFKSNISTAAPKLPKDSQDKNQLPSTVKESEREKSMNESERPKKIDSPIKTFMNEQNRPEMMQKSNQTSNVSQRQQEQPGQASKDSSKPASVGPEATCSKAAACSNDNDGEQAVKKPPAKPRGPPKKSKEAREAIVSSPPRAIVTTAPQRYLITHGTRLPMMAGPSSIPMDVLEQTTSSRIDAPQTPADFSKVSLKQKKPRKSTAKSGPATSTSSNANGSQQAATTKQSIICGLVAPPISTQAGAVRAANPSQQYLISRPLLYKTLPTLSAAQLQQMPRATLPLMSTAALSGAPVGLNATQPGARIVWATQPRPPIGTATMLPQVTNPSGIITTRAPTSVKSKSESSAPVRLPNVSSNSKQPQPDNAALLSLATTALSTVPLPTSTALSYLGGLRPPTGQAIMVSSATGQPALLAGQPFFNPFIPRMAGQFPTVGINSSIPNSGIAARPGATSQLVFARLPNQNQPRYLITQPYIQQRAQHTPTTVVSQPNQTLAFASFRPPCPSNPPKQSMKAKKVRTR